MQKIFKKPKLETQMKRIFFLLIFSCLSHNHIIAQSTAKSIVLGEDLDEISCHVKNIYAIDGNIYVDIDVIQVKYRISETACPQ